MSTPAIQLNNLCKHYSANVAVENLNLEVEKGEIFGFLGPNGAGKSTVLRMLLSLIKPTSGCITLFGKSVLLSRKEFLSNIGCIIEKPDFYLYLTAAQNLRLLAKLNDIHNAEKRIAEVIELVGLQGRQNEKVQTYSHGMKQRLGLAQALLHDPQLIILDEPTTGLDPQGIIELRYLLLRLKNEFGKTVVLSSHILSEVELIADSMIIMNKGKSMAQGSVKKLLSAENLIVKIETDDSQKLCSMLSQTEYSNAIEHTEPQSVSLKISRVQIPALNALMVQQNVSVFGIRYQRPLEEYFLKITQTEGEHV